MEIQLSSGLGPEECELAVGKLLRALELEFKDISVIDMVRGRRLDSYRSVRISSGSDLSFLVGTVKWVCESPYRKQHKRKNWFVDISLCAKQTQLTYNEELVRFETFRCGGKGGQNVNKVETGVRAIYAPTGLAVTSTEARSQHMNKRIALNRLCEAIAQQNNNIAANVQSLNRLEHSRIERGNPVRIYADMDFRKIEG
jgi:peptide chain release factor